MKHALMMLGVLLALPTPALAFDNFESFGLPLFPPPPVDPMVEPDPLGGGGGRYFTGSLSDGYTCSVCHFGGAEPGDPMRITIVPDPFVDGYRAGDAYQITLTLPGERDGGLSAGSLELVDLSGGGAGTIALVPDSAQVEDDKCAPDADGIRATAAHLADLTNPTRQVAGVDECGARRLRVTWTAPAIATGPVWLNAGGVWTPGGNDLPYPDPDDPQKRDHASVYARIIPPFGGVGDSGRVDNACSVSPTPARAPGPWLVALLLAGAALIGRRS